MAKSYDSKQVSVVFGDVIMGGFGPDTQVSVDFNEDAWTLQMGTDGEGTRSKSNNKSGRVTVTLMQSSDANRKLSELAVSDALTNGGVLPMLVRDASGASIHMAEQAWIVKVPTAEYGREAGTREWIFETDNLQHFVGGNN